MYRIIIADDEPMIRAGLYYRNDWEAMGFEVAALLEDGSDVLEYLKKERVDVLLTDICMYQVSGLQAAAMIREKYPWMKVVLLSGYKEFEYAREAMRLHVYEYLLKPIDYDNLRSVFEKIKRELDEANHEEQLLRSFGEEEYEKVLELTKAVAGSVVGEGEETWLAYARLKPMMRSATATAPSATPAMSGGMSESFLKRPVMEPKARFDAWNRSPSAQPARASGTVHSHAIP